MNKQLTKPLVIDTPNVIFYNMHRGEQQIRKNFSALLNLIASEIAVILIITPLLEKEFPQEMKWLISLQRMYNVNIIASTSGSDPDMVVLKIAQKFGGVVLSNDKFRQKEYDGVRNRCIRTGFYIRDKKIFFK